MFQTHINPIEAGFEMIVTEDDALVVMRIFETMEEALAEQAYMVAFIEEMGW